MGNLRGGGDHILTIEFDLWIELEELGGPVPDLRDPDPNDPVARMRNLPRPGIERELNLLMHLREMSVSRLAWLRPTHRFQVPDHHLTT